MEVCRRNSAAIHSVVQSCILRSRIVIVLQPLTSRLCLMTSELDLVMTDVLYVVRVTVAAPIGNWDHSSLSAVISIWHRLFQTCVLVGKFS